MIIQIPITVTEVFPNVRYPDYNGDLEKRKEHLVDALKSRLRRFSLNEALRYCADLNLFISSVPEDPLIYIEAQRPLIKMFFPKKAITKIRKLINRNRESPSRTVFSRSQVLEMIRWTLVCCPEKSKYSYPLQNNQSKTIFSEALLIAGEIASLQIEDTKCFEESDTYKKKLCLLTAVRRLALHSIKVRDLKRAFGRGKMMFFEFLPETLPNFASEFKKQNRLSLEEYFACLTVIITSYLYASPELETGKRHFITVSHINAQLPHMAKALTDYLGTQAQTIEQLKNVLWSTDFAKERLNLKPLREKPLFWLNQDVAMVLDPVIYADKTTLGPLFMINTPFHERIGHFGKAFEKYAQHILQIMHPEPEPQLLFGDTLIVPRTNEEICDAALIDDESLILFEMKAVFIPDDILFDEDYEQYVNALRSKYGKHRNDPRVGDQLAKAINNLITTTWALPNCSIRKIKRIYPILIVYDSLLELKGHFWFCNADFKMALTPDGILAESKLVMAKGQWEIAPLTIMTVDMLEDLEASVKNFSLTQLLYDYFSFYDANFLDANNDLSLREFIHQSKYAQKMDAGGSVATKAQELLKESQQILLPENNNQST